MLRLRQRDIRLALGDLEALVLRELWMDKNALSVREFRVKVSRARPVAITTVATILDRLYRKGIVSRQLVREGGPHYLYSPKLTEDQFRHEIVANVMAALLRSFSAVTVAYLTEKMATKPSDHRLLSRYLNRLRDKARE